MNLKCIDNQGFEDVLTVGKVYRAQVVGNSCFLQTDKGSFGWYGLVHFGIEG